MLQTRFFRTAGQCHNFDINQCQDKIHICSDPTHTTIALCDGAGSSPYGGLAAEITSKVTTEYLHSNFETFLYDSIPNIKRKITRIIDNELLKKAREFNINPSLLATTVLAISMDCQGRFAGINLGDGTILWQLKEHEELQTVSSPQHGSTPNSTYLTMNTPLFYYLRIYRWTIPEIKQLILLSDGMECLKNSFTRSTFSSEKCEILNQTMIDIKAFDDMSYVLCELKTD